MGTAPAGRLFRFAGVGALGTGAYLIAYVVLRQALGADAASAVARVGVAVPTTWLNGRYTFRRRTTVWRLHLGGLALLGVGTVTTWLALAVETALVVHPDRRVELLTVVLATVLAAGIRFCLMRTWLFRAKSAGAGLRSSRAQRWRRHVPGALQPARQCPEWSVSRQWLPSHRSAVRAQAGDRAHSLRQDCAAGQGRRPCSRGTRACPSAKTETMTSRRQVRMPATALLLGATMLTAGCGGEDSTGATSASPKTTASTSAPAQGGPGGRGSLKTFTAVDLDTDGLNAGGANTAEVVAAAQKFLATLSADEKAKAALSFSDNQSRQTWSNYPTTTVARKGVALSALDTAGRTAALALVKAMLSADGYTQVQTIQQADDWLKANSSGGNSSFGDDLYYIAVYGTPSPSDPFMVQFGGHHLARNYTYKGTTASITPAFTGTEPKTFTIDGTSVEPMKEKAGAFFAAFDSLSAEQAASAKLSTTLNDILMGPGVDSGTFPASQGLAMSSLSDGQQQLVLAAIAAWVDDAAPGEAASLMSTYSSQLGSTKIAYASTKTVDGENTYLRIDGPRVWVELINTRSMSTPNVHYHGVFRDKKDDYGSTNPSA